MASRLGASLVPETGSLRDAMTALDRGARQIALVVDADGRLVGVVTDGDVRRALLGGASLDDPVSPRTSRRFVSVGPGDGRAEALDLMRARRVSAVPVVDGSGRPAGLHLLHEFIEPVERPNWAVVMAGGQGTRLRPLTDAIPKPMLRVAGRPILERIVLHLVGHGIRRMFVSVNYLGHVIEDHFGDGSAYGARIEYLREAEALGTAGSLTLLPSLPEAPILVMNGDLVTSADVGGLLDAHAASGAVATVGVRRYLHTVPFGCVERDGDRVVRLEEKPTLARDVNSGIYAISPVLLERVPVGRASSMPDLLEGALDRGERVAAYRGGGRLDRRRPARPARPGAGWRVSGLRDVPVLVTGADGFIGSHLAERLAAEGARVRAFCLYNSRGSAGWLDESDPALRASMEVVFGDIRDARFVERAAEGAEVVFHLAALIAIPYSYHAPESFVDTNVRGTLNVLEAARRAGARRFVQTSTSEVYGTPAELPIRETHPLNAQSPYAATKVAADQLSLAFGRSFGLPVVVLRPFNTYGPRQSQRAVLPTMLRQLLAGRQEIRLGRLDTRRDLTFVRDTVDGFVRAATAAGIDDATIQLGTGRAESIGELFDIAQRLCGSRARPVLDSARLRPDASEVLVLQSDPSKARALLGWEAATSLEDGVAATVEWIRHHPEERDLDDVQL